MQLRKDLHIQLPTIEEIVRYAHTGKFPPIAGGAVSAHWYNKGMVNINNNTVDWVNTATIRCALATTTYSPNRDTDEHYDPAFSANEVANGNGYTTKGIALTGRSVSSDDTTDQARLISTTNPSWGPGATFDFRYAIVYEDSGTATTSHLLGYVDCSGSGNLSVVNGTLTITWDSTGVLRLDAQ